MLTVIPKVDGALRLSSLFGVVDEIVEAVREVEASDLDFEERPSDWLVDDMGKNVNGEFFFKLTPERLRAYDAANKFRVGFRQLIRDDDLPRFFTPEVLKHTNRALQLMRTDGVGSFSIATRKKTDATTSVAAKVDRLVKSEYSELATIDGDLQRIEWDEQRPKFFIRHPLSGTRIRCEFSPEDLEQAKDAFPHRVEVSGMLRYNAQRQPTTIDVARFARIPDEEALPTLDDLRSVNITNGLDPHEFVQRMRNGE